MKKQGFTLVEIMVAVFLSTIVLGGVYGIWTQVSRHISISNAKQKLQHELRNSTNYIQNDFKSIKADTFELTDENPAGTSFKIEFEKFAETQDGKLAQDSTEKIGYSLLNGILTRSTTNGMKILSAHVDSMKIQKAVDEANLSAGSLEATDEDFRAGREAQLDISLAGKIIVEGLGTEMFHVEKTSVVMRDEYMKKTNKTYKSNFDLTKEDLNKIVVKDSSQDALFSFGSAFTEEQLSMLDKEQLEGLLANQNDLLAQAESSLKDLKKGIEGTDTGESFLSKTGDFLAFWSESDGERVRGWRSDLAKASTVSATRETVDKMKSFVQTKENEFLGNSISNYSSMTEEQKKIYKEAYEMKIQDRSLNGAYEIMCEQAEKNETEAPEKPTLNIDVATGDSSFSYVDGSGAQVNVQSDNEGRERAEALRAAYDNIDLAWMGEFGEEDDEVEIYNAAKSLINQGEAKITLQEMRDTSQGNIDLISDVIATK